MEEYAEELRTPPVSLVSLVGFPELHPTITSYLHSEQPPINTLALPDFSKVSIMARKQKEILDSVPSAGILKRDWLSKHRTRVPAVVAALFDADHVAGDPAQWLQVCTDLENLKTVIHGRNIKLVVVLVQSSVNDDVSEDRLIALRKRAEIDSKYLLVFVQKSTSEVHQSLKRLGITFAELSNTYYRDEGRRIKTRLEKKNFSSIELNIRCCFKVAVYAEFRRDWGEALRFYEDAYHALREMIRISTRLPPIQRLGEIKAVAEQLHFKISTLLLHGGKVVEAITWFQQHVTFYKRLVGEPEVAFLHWEWLSRQFLVFAELLETSSATIPSTMSHPLGTSERPLTDWEFQPAYHCQAAAHYLYEKRHCLDLSSSISESPQHPDLTNTTRSNLESVTPSVYVGQFARLPEQADSLSMQPLTDAEYMLYTLAEGKRFQDSSEIIALLRKSLESYNDLKSRRMASYCSNRMAREYFAIGDFSNAKQIFDGVAGLYRQEAWVTLLWEILGYLRECSRKLGSLKDFIEYSLEMAALPILSGFGEESPNEKGVFGPAGSPSLLQREIIQDEVFKLLRGEPVLSSESGSSLTIQEDQIFHLEVDPVSPLRAVCLASVAFHNQAVKPGTPTLFTLSLLSQLPHPVEIDQLEIEFNQSICNFTISNTQKMPSSAISIEKQVPRVEMAPTLTLITNKWLRLTHEIKSGQSGKLECLSIVAKIGHHFTICCRAESPASMEDLALWKYEDRMETFPTKDPGLSFSGQKVIQVEEPEAQVDLVLSASGPALVGENFMVPVKVTSTGHAVHSAELKINLVDARGGGLASPREIEPFSLDNHHVELLGIHGSNLEDEFQTDTDKIKKIQGSFGLLSVPFLDIGDSWSCKLEIIWHRPKPVMLYVSLGYSPNDKEASAQKIHVHKSLQIEGKTAVAISHRFTMPFRRDPLLLSKIKTSDPNQSPSLALNEASVLVISTRNCTEVPLRVISMSIELDEGDIGRSCTVRHGSRSSIDQSLLVPGEEYKKVFSVTPLVDSTKLEVGTVCLRWRRDSVFEQPLDSGAPTIGVVTKYKLPAVNVEKPPLVVSLECPPHAILGDPFSYYVRIQNQTQLFQEIKYSLADSQSFVLSGAHNDASFILPYSELILRYKLIPLFSGSQQLPRVTVTSVRYSAGLLSSTAASTIFVFPSKPCFKMDEEGGTRSEPISSE